MSLSFYKIIERVFPSEGGYLSAEQAAQQGDPGGETHWGISKRAFPNVDIKSLTREQAIEIYRTDYWARIHGDELPSAISFAMLDAAINSGWSKSIMWLQKAAGVADDGKFGPITRDAVAKTSTADLMLLISSERLDFMTRLNNWPVNSRGWARRIAENLRYGAEDN
jgi:lysozyme family protein